MPTATPYGCLRPPDDYTLVVIRDEYELNQRTLAMLEHAQTLYDGSHDFVKAITTKHVEIQSWAFKEESDGTIRPISRVLVTALTATMC